MSANFTPNQNDYTNLTPFKTWLLCQINTWGQVNFPFVESDFDELTNYGMLMKLMKALNDVISNQNEVEQDVTNLFISFTELQTYVNEYLTEDNLQPLINNKLDEMVSDGTIANLINNDLFSSINNKILQNSVNIGTINDDLANTIKTTDSNKVGMSLLTQEVRTALTGGSTAVVGTNSVNTINISDNAVTIYKLDDLIENNFTKQYANVSFGDYVSGNFKQVVENAIVNQTNNAYRYYDIALENNTIYEFSGFNYYAVNSIIVYDPNDSNAIIFYTPVASASAQYEHIKLIFKTNKAGLKAYVNLPNVIDSSHKPEFQLLPTLSKIKEITKNNKKNYIEKIKTINNYYPVYTNMTSSTPHLIFNDTVTCSTDIYKISKGTKYTVESANIYQNCGLIITNEKLEASYLSNDENVGNRPVPFTYEFTASDDGYVLLMNIESSTYTIASNIYVLEEDSKYKTMKWALIGDSLTDPNVNSSVKKYYSYVQDDLGITIQNLGQSGCGYKRTLDGGNNFVSQSLLVDSNVDVITIFGSFNDHNIYDTNGLGNINDNTTESVFGCINITIENLIANHPNAKIGIILPTPWNNPSCNPYNPRALDIQYIDGIKTIARKHSIPVLDLFYESDMFPWNENFRNMFYVNNDGTHPNDAGNKRFAYQIENFITKLI